MACIIGKRFASPTHDARRAFSAQASTLRRALMGIFNITRFALTTLESGMPAVDWSQMFSFTMSPLELFLRGTLTYFFLFCLFRFVVRRDVGAIGISDLLVLVIIADASQNAMAGGYKSVVDGFVLIGTIIGWSYALNYLSYHFEPIRRFALPRPACIIRDGIKQEKILQRELITDEELSEMLREHGIENLSEVKRAYLEPDGQVTVIQRKRTDNSHKPDRHRAI
jgi:uncharacterized membrane protein YcaP (DUF421 family)